MGGGGQEFRSARDDMREALAVTLSEADGTGAIVTVSGLGG